MTLLLSIIGGILRKNKLVNYTQKALHYAHKGQIKISDEFETLLEDFEEYM